MWGSRERHRRTIAHPLYGYIKRRANSRSPVNSLRRADEWRATLPVHKRDKLWPASDQDQVNGKETVERTRFIEDKTEFSGQVTIEEWNCYNCKYNNPLTEQSIAVAGDPCLKYFGILIISSLLRQIKTLSNWWRRPRTDKRWSALSLQFNGLRGKVQTNPLITFSFTL